MNTTAAAAAGMTKLTLSFLLSLLSDNNYPGPEAPVSSKHHWAYKGPEGPDSWHVHYKYCAGERQSPIDILPLTCEYDPGLEPFILDNFDYTSARTGPCVLNVTNNGHAASVRVSGEDLRVRGGGLQGVYKTAEFHFHWGSTDDLGSEHALDGIKFPLEMHVVNYAEKYGTIKQAMNKPDGLAVLGVLFQLSEVDNPSFAALDEALKHVHKAGEHNLVEQLVLRTLLPDDLSRYWRYNGSLTTPYCFESVIWTVFTEPQKISHTQLETLRSLLHEEGHDMNDRGDHHTNTPSRLVDNWRPLQPLHGRKVTRSFPEANYMSSRGSFHPVPAEPTTTTAASTTTNTLTTVKTDSGHPVPTSNDVDPIPHASHTTSDNNDRNQIHSYNGNSANNYQNNVHGNRVLSPSQSKPMESSHSHYSPGAASPTQQSSAPRDSYANSDRAFNNNENSIHSFQPYRNSASIQSVLFDMKQDPSLVYLTSGASPVRTLGNVHQNVDSQKNAQTPVNGNIESTGKMNDRSISNTSNLPQTPTLFPSSAPESNQAKTAQFNLTGQNHEPSPSSNQANSGYQQPSQNYRQPPNQPKSQNLPLSYLMQPQNQDSRPGPVDRMIPSIDGHLYNGLSQNTQRQSSPTGQPLSSEHLRSILEKLAATNRINTRYSPNSAQQTTRLYQPNSVPAESNPEFSNHIRDRDGNLMMIDRTNGEVYMVRQNYNNWKQQQGGSYPQQLQRQYISQQPPPPQDRYSDSYSIISTANMRADDLGAPRDTPVEPYSSVFLPRMERPVRISSPYYDRVNAARQQPQAPAASLYNYLVPASTQYQAPRYHPPNVGQRLIG
ncbi:bromodomain-containing protein [Biomphalaria pfeifferi]|uniref:Carbonic anhydrase n=1 Tax=Biomphalaria pfeifferi TaxID=112525 RepID=A0AAD8BIW0_BIOPF|nr:bromodomain-containing protein [Biomphalaria pfeifferi]